jgi:hypothetical protein
MVSTPATTSATSSNATWLRTRVIAEKRIKAARGTVDSASSRRASTA